MNLVATKEGLDKPLGCLAGDIRRSINEQRTRQQIEAYQALVRANARPLRPLPVFLGKAQMHHIRYPNWTQSGVYQTDFLAASVAKRRCGRTLVQIKKRLCTGNLYDGRIFWGTRNSAASAGHYTGMGIQAGNSDYRLHLLVLLNYGERTGESSSPSTNRLTHLEPNRLVPDWLPHNGRT